MKFYSQRFSFLLQNKFFIEITLITEIIFYLVTYFSLKLLFI